MASKLDATTAVVDQQTLIQGVAKYFREKVYGPEGMPWGTRFDDLGLSADAQGSHALRPLSVRGIAPDELPRGIHGQAFQPESQRDREVLVRGRSGSNLATSLRLPERDRAIARILGAAASRGERAT